MKMFKKRKLYLTFNTVFEIQGYSNSGRQTCNVTSIHVVQNGLTEELTISTVVL